jgi:hypothetical protein
VANSPGIVLIRIIRHAAVGETKLDHGDPPSRWPKIQGSQSKSTTSLSVTRQLTKFRYTRFPHPRQGVSTRKLLIPCRRVPISPGRRRPPSNRRPATRNAGNAGTKCSDRLRFSHFRALNRPAPLARSPRPTDFPESPQTQYPQPLPALADPRTRNPESVSAPPIATINQNPQPGPRVSPARAAPIRTGSGSDRLNPSGKRQRPVPPPKPERIRGAQRHPVSPVGPP